MIVPRLKYGKIDSLNELQKQKKRLKIKIKMREKLLDKHFKDLTDDLEPKYIVNQAFKLFDIPNPFTGIGGSFIKSFLLQKEILVPALSAVASWLGVSWLMRKFRKK